MLKGVWPQHVSTAKAIIEERESEEEAEVESLRKQKTWEGFELFAQSEALGLAAAVCCVGNILHSTLEQ